MSDYTEAQEKGLTSIDRWGEGIDHHPMSVRLMEFLSIHDYEDYDDYFCWKMGGDGDNGETLMYQMDEFFEIMERSKEPIKKKTCNCVGCFLESQCGGQL